MTLLALIHAAMPTSVRGWQQDQSESNALFLLGKCALAWLCVVQPFLSF